MSAASGSEPLFPPATFDPLVGFARTLTVPILCAAIELRLAAGCADLDLSISLEEATVRGHSSDAPAPLRSALAPWADATDPPWTHVPSAWVEVDAPTGADVGGSWARAFPFFRVAELLASGDPEPTLARMLTTLLAPAERPRAQAGEMLATLPRGAAVRHIAALSHRGAAEARLQAVAPAGAVLDAIDSQFGPRSRAALESRRLTEGLPLRVAVQTRSTGGEAALYSLELAYPHGPLGDPVWRELLRRAVETGRASQDKARALLAWPGAGAHVLAGAPTPICIERHFHVSLPLAGEGALKAYAHCSPRFVLFR